MHRDLRSKINSMLKNKAHRKTFFKVVSGLMAVVVFCTTYALILPGITMSQKTYCGLEEHTHTEDCLFVPTVVLASICDPVAEADYVLHTHDSSCYDRNGKLICSLEELEAHSHTQDCYEDVREITCGLFEREEHYHGEECYNTIYDLTCGQLERTGHSHDESCYSYEYNPVCGLDEDEFHTHTEQCYTKTGVLTCGLEEQEGHSHTQDCYTPNTILTCEKSEGAAHTHSEECYEVVQKLTCGKQEFILHQHDESCYDENGELVCEMPVVISHSHTDSCFGEKLTTLPAEESDSQNQGEQGATLSSENSQEETAYICGMVEHTHSEECFQTPEALQFDFNVEDDNVSGTITLPWSEDLPEDLTCTVIVLQGTEENYQAMYEAAEESLEAPAGDISDISLYQLEWSSEGEIYQLPEGITPVISLNVATEDDVDKITALVINQMQETAADDTQPSGGQTDISVATYEEDEDTIEEEEEESNEILASAMSSTDSTYPSYVTLQSDNSSSGRLVLLSAVSQEDSYSDPIDIESGTETDTDSESVPSAVQESYEYAQYADTDAEEYNDDYTSNDDIVYTYSAVSVDADNDGTVAVEMDSNISTFALARSRSITGTVSYYTRVDSLDQISDYDYYIIMFANGQAMLPYNYEAYTGTTSASSYTTSSWYTPKKVTINQVSGGQNDRYFVFRDENGNYINSTNYSYYHWTIVENTITDSSSYTDSTKLANGLYYADSPSYIIRNAYNSRWLWAGQDRYNTSSYISYFGTAWELQRRPENEWRLITMHSTDGSSMAYYTLRYDWQNVYKTTTTVSYYADTVTYHTGKISSDTGLLDENDYRDNIIIYKLAGSSIPDWDDEDVAKEAEAVEYEAEKNPNTYENDAEKITSTGKSGVDSNNLKELSGSTLSYASDPATSLIKEEFSFLDQDPENMDSIDLMEMQESNDGRVVTDKSVIYGDDDFVAYDDDDYEQGDFSVTLSALGQEWTVEDDQETSIPVDIVFILDLSGSMNTVDNSDTNSETRWESSVDALNYISKEIMSRNSQNRIGLVAFSNIAKEILPVDHYSYEDEDMPFLDYDSTAEKPLSTLTVSQGVVGETAGEISFNLGANSSSTDDGYGFWGNTFTQAGLEQAYKTISKVNSTTATITFTSSEGEVVEQTVKRQPLIILLSDGDPTMGTHDYMTPSEGVVYGKGTENTIFGYYTVLSANYFKNMTSIKYGKTAYMYTIGLGIDGSTELQKYALSVLDPTPAKLAAISDSSKYYSFKSMLTSEEYLYRYSTTFTNADRSNGKYGAPTGFGKTTDMLTAADGNNPYDDYAYADGAFYGAMDSTKLESVMEAILNAVQSTVRYNFLLENSTSVVFTDTIGDGMEVKDASVLRYNGENLEASTVTDGEEDGRAYTEYRWTDQTVIRYVYSHKAEEVSLDDVYVRVYHSDDDNPNETLVFSIPEEVMPNYFPSESFQFYFEAHPIRLIYRVGLSQDELNSIIEDTDAISNKVYYTSKYDATASNAENAKSTTVTFTTALTDPRTGLPLAEDDDSEALLNPYYTAENLAKVDTDIYKSSNITGTYKYAFTESIVKHSNSRYVDVVQYLGNNGKLTLKRSAISKIAVNKEWVSSGTETDKITIRLYGSGTRTNLTTSESTKGVWCLEQVELTSKDKNQDGTWSYNWNTVLKNETIGNYSYSYDNFYIRESSASVGRGDTDVLSQYIVSYKDKDGAGIDTTTLTLSAIDSDYAKVHPILDGTDTVEVVTANSGEVTVLNAKQYTLPYSGGSGENMLYTGGAMLVVLSGAARLLIKARKYRMMQKLNHW